MTYTEVPCQASPYLVDFLFGRRSRFLNAAPARGRTTSPISIEPISWTASTDNVVFGVSAYDAAGNVSPVVQVGATTEQPSPSPSASRPA